jgi:uroporphyrinogen-III synthase
MRVVVTRPAAEAAEWVDSLRAHGFDAVSLPLIDIRPVSDPAPLAHAWARLGDFAAVMFVSANAVRGFFAARAEGVAFTPRAWATGAGTRNALLGEGVAQMQVDSPPAGAAQFDSESLWTVVAPQCRPGGGVLLVRGGEGRDWLEQKLVQSGVHVQTVLAYARAMPQFTPEQQALAAECAGAAWIFSSSQAVANLRRSLPLERWDRARAVATHPRIAAAAREAGFHVVCESRPSLADVIAALESAG